MPSKRSRILSIERNKVYVNKSFKKILTLPMELEKKNTSNEDSNSVSFRKNMLYNEKS